MLSGLADRLDRREAQRRLPPLLAEALRSNSGAAAPCQAACLEPGLLTRLAAKLGPQAFLDSVHPVLMRFLGSSHAEHRPPPLSQVGTLYNAGLVVISSAVQLNVMNIHRLASTTSCCCECASRPNFSVELPWWNEPTH